MKISMEYDFDSYFSNAVSNILKHDLREQTSRGQVFVLLMEAVLYDFKEYLG